MIQKSKILLIIIFGWTTIVSLIGLVFSLSATTLQILFSVPIALVAAIAAEKPKSIDLIQYEDRIKNHHESEKKAKKSIFQKYLKEIEMSYRIPSYKVRKDFFSIMNYSVFFAERTMLQGIILANSLTIMFGLNEKDVFLELNLDTQKLHIYEYGEEKSLYNSYENRRKVYQRIIKYVYKNTVKEERYKVKIPTELNI